MLLHILVGTMTDNATRVAEEIEHHAKGGPWQVRIDYMDQIDASVFRAPALFLLCVSTYGQGDVPDNAKRLYQELGSARPDLRHVRYGVFGLGDRTHVGTFNFGAKRFDELLTALGAQRVGARMEHDASEGELPEDIALDWFRNWSSLSATPDTA